MLSYQNTECLYHIRGLQYYLPCLEEKAQPTLSCQSDLHSIFSTGNAQVVCRVNAICTFFDGRVAMQTISYLMHKPALF